MIIDIIFKVYGVEDVFWISKLYLGLIDEIIICGNRFWNNRIIIEIRLRLFVKNVVIFVFLKVEVCVNIVNIIIIKIIIVVIIGWLLKKFVLKYKRIVNKVKLR